MKCYIWSISLCGAETWTLRKVDEKCGTGEEWGRLNEPIV
jgi:hypothetical protein